MLDLMRSFNMYKIFSFIDATNNEQTSIIRMNGDGSFTSFPAQEGNALYQEYLKWVAEGNTPEPADE